MVGENYKAPEITLKNSWINQKISENKEGFVASEISWWKNFNDPILEQIVVIALENNYSYQTAQSKVFEARANVDLKNSDLLPKASASLNPSRRNNFFNPINPANRPIINFFTAGFDASWEIDLFGGNRRAKRAAKNLAEASNEAKNYLAISLIAEIVRSYSNLRLAQNKLMLQKEISNFYQEIFEISQKKAKSGLIGVIDLNNIKIEMLNNQQELSIAEAEAEIALYSLELLLGKGPKEMEELLKKNAKVPLIKQEIIAATPFDVVRNRPDVKQAERELAASVELKGFALAQVFPKISLNGFLGFVGPKQQNLFTKQGQSFSIGNTITMPVLNFGGLSSQIKASEQRKQQALLNYQMAVNQALFDVESSLVAFLKGKEKFDFANQAYQANLQNYQLNEKRYKNGLISHLEFLRLEIALRKAKLELINVRLDFSNKTVALYKALGGGWQLKDKAIKPDKSSLQEVRVREKAN